MRATVRLTLESAAVTDWAERVLPTCSRHVQTAWPGVRLVEIDEARFTDGVTITAAAFDVAVQARSARGCIDRAWIVLSARVPRGAHLVLDHDGGTLVQVAVR